MTSSGFPSSSHPNEGRVVFPRVRSMVPAFLSGVHVVVAVVDPYVVALYHTFVVTTRLAVIYAQRIASVDRDGR